MHRRGDRRQQTEDNTIVQSSFSATINAPIEKIDIPSWCFGLSKSEYQSCSPAHVSVVATTARDSRRMSINVEVLGGITEFIRQFQTPIASRDSSLSKQSTARHLDTNRNPGYAWIRIFLLHNLCLQIQKMVRLNRPNKFFKPRYDSDLAFTILTNGMAK